MGGFPSHDAPIFLFTTAVQKPNEAGAGIEVCLVPLLRRHYNDSVKRVKDTLVQVGFGGPPHTTQIVVNSFNNKANPAGPTITVATPADPVTTAAAVTAYNSVEYLLSEVESAFYSSGRVVLEAGELAKEKVEAMLARREARRIEEEKEYYKGVSLLQSDKEEKPASPPAPPKVEAEDEPDHPAMPMNKKQWPMLRPVPCAICIIEPDVSGSGKKGTQPNKSGAFTVNGVQLTDSFQLNGRRMFCVGILNCSTKPDSRAYIHSVVEKCTISSAEKNPAESTIPVEQRIVNGINATAANDVPRLYSVPDDGLDVYFDIKLEHEEEFRHMLDPILFLASINFRSQYLTCSMWQKPPRSREVEDAYYHHLRLLRFHCFLSGKSPQLKLFHEQYPLLSLIEETGLNDRWSKDEAKTDKSKEDGEEEEDVEVANYVLGANSETPNTLEDQESQHGQDDDPVLRKKVRQRSKRRSRKPRCPLPQDEIYRTTTCRAPELHLYQKENGETGLEAIVDGDLVARFMKYVTDIASFETIKNSFVRVDMGPFYKERRYLQSVQEHRKQSAPGLTEELETVYGSEEVANKVKAWLAEREKLEESRKAAAKLEEEQRRGVAAFPNMPGVTFLPGNPTAFVQPGLPKAQPMAFPMQTPQQPVVLQPSMGQQQMQYMIHPATGMPVSVAAPQMPMQQMYMQQPQISYTCVQTPQGMMLIPVQMGATPQAQFMPQMPMQQGFPGMPINVGGQPMPMQFQQQFQQQQQQAATTAKVSQYEQWFCQPAEHTLTPT
ncbi:hypothetical protein ADEAN_000270100 [Angomonas deanei]|uniref:Uncharacterized protein n=1 Tax=Angomonas deanei TaxID=59799 RepID=A0A7G2C688_9TRYP|nr:hypothetical protein ADEAN_000270100 [Angomonas deanei]